MKISFKKYQEITKKWNPRKVLSIEYRTRFAEGNMMMSCAFFEEFYKRIVKLFKGCEITKCLLLDSTTGIALKYFDSLEEVLNYHEK